MQTTMTIGTHTLEWGKQTYVMGILNLTPDSFSGDGLLSAKPPEDAGKSSSAVNEPPLEAVADILPIALEQARRFVAAGAHILDIGGESTRPDSQPVSVEEEENRILPIIRAIALEFDVIISVDTYKSTVAEAALNAGAHIINDIWGLKADPEMGKLAASYHAPVILMHNRSSWASPEVKERLGGRYVGVPYQNLLDDVQRELLESVELAHSAGIQEDRIILDPGIGFGKTVSENLELVNRLDVLRNLGYPVLLGPSRKSFIGKTLDLPAEQRLEGTAAAVAIGIARGADIIRVHDVEFMARVVRMADAIIRRNEKGDFHVP